MFKPHSAFVFGDDPTPLPCQTTSDGFAAPNALLRLVYTPDELAIHVSSPGPSAPGISRLVLRWNATFTPESLFLADHWERGYGDLQWRHAQPERMMPWYFAAHDIKTHQSHAFGVKTAPAAMCFWTVDPNGISLWLDLRNGTGPVNLGPREICAARVITDHSTPTETPFAFLCHFCKRLCPQPLLPPHPIVGNNNWYYAYGENFDQHVVLRDAAFMAQLAANHAVKPFSVIDAGWCPGSCCHGGPWNQGLPDKFPDMPGLASKMKALGVRPGIWIRPSALTTVDDPRRLLIAPDRKDPEKPLDLSLPENLEQARLDMARMHDWGFELVKHDFSTFDAFGKWGFDCGPELSSGHWQWRDTSLTNAEVLLNWYKALRQGAGDALLLGCNTVGHLGAGLFDIQRTGDDTSGKVWERTRRYGVNTLAFRLPQHNAFFSADPDCTAHTPNTPWDKDRQWLDLVARSGNALFLSADPEKLSPEQTQAFAQAVQIALSGGEPGGVEPLDWLYSTCPAHWRVGNHNIRYDWTESFGTWAGKT